MNLKKVSSYPDKRNIRPVKKDLSWLASITSFASARIILTSNNLRIFDLLEQKNTADFISKKLEIDKRATELLLNSLVAIGLLKKVKNFFKNDLIASRYLVKGKPLYQGNILDHFNCQWENWTDLDKIIKTGTPNHKNHHHKSFILGMHNQALPQIGRVLKNIDFKGVKNILDVGGGPGTYSMAFARKGIKTTLLDYPESLPFAQELIEKAGLKKKIRLLSGDFLQTPLKEPFDMIFISQVLHRYNMDIIETVIKKLRYCLKPKGKLVIQETLIDLNHTWPLTGALFSINMLVNTYEGRSYPPEEIIRCLKKNGFKIISKHFFEDAYLISSQPIYNVDSK